MPGRPRRQSATCTDRCACRVWGGSGGGTGREQTGSGGFGRRAGVAVACAARGPIPLRARFVLLAQLVVEDVQVLAKVVGDADQAMDAVGDVAGHRCLGRPVAKGGSHIADRAVAGVVQDLGADQVLLAQINQVLDLVRRQE